MQTIQEDLNDLDRMVDSNARKEDIRAQIRLIARVISALEADHAGFVESHAKLKTQNAALQRDLDALKSKPKDSPFDPVGDVENDFGQHSH